MLLFNRLQELLQASFLRPLAYRLPNNKTDVQAAGCLLVCSNLLLASDRPIQCQYKVPGTCTGCPTIDWLPDNVPHRQLVNGAFEKVFFFLERNAENCSLVPKVEAEHPADCSSADQTGSNKGGCCSRCRIVVILVWNLHKNRRISLIC